MQKARQEAMDPTDDTGNATEPAERITHLNALRSPNGASNTGPQQPQSEWDSFLSSLRTKPIDPEGWNKLVRLAEESRDIMRIKEAYDGLLSVYPTSVRSDVVPRDCEPPDTSTASYADRSTSCLRQSLYRSRAVPVRRGAVQTVSFE